jgi:hypothetical protein
MQLKEQQPGLQTMVGLENTGNLGLDWSVTSGSSWLTVSNAIGVLAGRAKHESGNHLNESTMVLTEGTHETTGDVFESDRRRREYYDSGNDSSCAFRSRHSGVNTCFEQSLRRWFGWAV